MAGYTAGLARSTGPNIESSIWIESGYFTKCSSANETSQYVKFAAPTSNLVFQWAFTTDIVYEIVKIYGAYPFDPYREHEVCSPIFTVYLTQQPGDMQTVHLPRSILDRPQSGGLPLRVKFTVKVCAIARDIVDEEGVMYLPLKIGPKLIHTQGNQYVCVSHHIGDFGVSLIPKTDIYIAPGAVVSFLVPPLTSLWPCKIKVNDHCFYDYYPSELLISNVMACPKLISFDVRNTSLNMHFILYKDIPLLDYVHMVSIDKN